MNNQFDELAKAMAQSVTRRAALKKFGIGMGLIALTALGLSNNAHAGKHVKLGGPGDPCPCRRNLVCRIVGLRAICTQPNGIPT
jgi:hypothetical protein